MYRCILVLLLVVCASHLPSVAARIFDAGERERVTISLAEGWEYTVDPHGDAPRDAWARALPAGMPVKFPFRWDGDPRTLTCDGVIWYTRLVTLPEKIGRAGALLVIENPVGMMDVYIDGMLQAHFLGNGLTKRLPITGDPGSQHRLTMRVDRRALPEAIRRVTPCGFGGVSLEMLPPARLETMTVSVAVSSETVSIFCRISADDACRAELHLRLLPLNSRHAVERTKKPILLDLPAGTSTHRFTLPARRLRRWSPSTPVVYRLYADLALPGKIHDSYQVLMGVCTPTVSSEKQLLVNGARVTMRGLRVPGGVVQPSPVAVAQGLVAELSDAERINYRIRLSDGVPLTAELLSIADKVGLTEMLLLRRVGYNALMADGAALSEDVLALADHLGILVIAEIPPTLDGEGLLQPDIATTIEEVSHHPCIVAWSWRSAGRPTAEVATLRALDPVRPALVRGDDGTYVYTSSFPTGARLAEIDVLDSPNSAAWQRAIDAVAAGTLPVLLSGTALSMAPHTDLDSQQDEQQRLSDIRYAVESILRARYPIGYFIRPPRGTGLTGLVTATGGLTQACYAAMAYNSPCMIALRVTKRDGFLHSDIRLVNEQGAAGDYRLYRLLTTPAGLTKIEWTSPDSVNALTEGHVELQNLSEKLPPVPITEPGVYRVQYVLYLASKVMACSQPMAVTADVHEVE